MISEELWRPLKTDFLIRWPTLAELKAVKKDTVRRFYHAHESRRADVVEKRLALIAGAEPMTEDKAMIQAARLKIQRLAEEIAVVTRHIARYDKAIAEIYAAHPDAALYDSLPGSGPAPRQPEAKSKTAAPRQAAIPPRRPPKSAKPVASAQSL